MNGERAQRSSFPFREKVNRIGTVREPLSIRNTTLTTNHPGKLKMARPRKRELLVKFISHSLDIIGKRNGFSSGDDYLQALAQRRGFQSLEQFQETLIRKVERSVDAHRRMEHWSDRQWEKLLARLTPKHASRKLRAGMKRKNRILAELMDKRLIELGKTQMWLAEQLGISRQAVHMYFIGTRYPRKSILPLLKEILNIDDL